MAARVELLNAYQEVSKNFDQKHPSKLRKFFGKDAIRCLAAMELAQTALASST